MSQAPTIIADAPRIVFFGLPDAGKSALLAALSQAQAQGQLRGKHLLDLSAGLGQLQKNLYENGPEPQPHDLVDYPVAVEPIKPGPAESAAVHLVDSDGRQTAQLLQAPPNGTGAGGLALALAAADTLVLVVDASAEAGQLKPVFAQVVPFLRQLEEKRTCGMEVTGLPVYLVLTKCDLLAKKTDNTPAWIERIEDRKRKIAQLFHDFLARELSPSALAFGKLDLHLWATAVGRPALADQPAKPAEPFGVAELFRQCLDSAQDFHHRRKRASHLLQSVVAGTLALVGFLGLMGLVFFTTRPDPQVQALENDINAVLPSKDLKPADRLKEPLDDKIKKLQKMQANPVFARLPADVQGAVQEFVDEAQDYRRFDREFAEKVPEPRYATGEADLDKIEDEMKELEKKPLYAGYAAAWKETKPGKRFQEYRGDVQILRQEVAEAKQWFQEQKGECEVLKVEGKSIKLELDKLQLDFEKLLLAKKQKSKEMEQWKMEMKKWGLEAVKWATKFEQFKDRSYFTRLAENTKDKYPDKVWDENSRIPGSANLTFAAVLSFDRVVRASVAWRKYLTEDLDKLWKELNRLKK